MVDFFRTLYRRLRPVTGGRGKNDVVILSITVLFFLLLIELSIVFPSSWCFQIQGSYKVGTSYFPEFWTDPLSLGSDTAGQIIYSFIYVILSLNLGWIFFGSLLKRARLFASISPPCIMYFITWPLGYLVTVALNRLILLVPHRVAPDACYLLVLVINISYLVSRIFEYQRRPSRPSPGQVRTMIFLILLASLFYLWSFQPGNRHIVSDQSELTNFILIDYCKGDFSQLPIVGQHYDEVAFLFPVLKCNSVDFLAAHWHLYSLLKFSFFLVIFFILRVAGATALQAILGSIFLFLGSICLLPGHLPVYFDDPVPFAHSGHPMRIFLSIMPISVMVLLNKGVQLSEKSFLMYCNVFLLGVGLSAVSAHVTFLLLAMSVYYFFENIFIYYSAQENDRVRTNLNSCYVLWLFVLLGTYLIPSWTYNRFGAFLLLIGFIIICTLWIKDSGVFLVRTRTDKLKKIWADKKRETRLLFILAVGFVVGFCFLGNVFTGKVYEAIFSCLGVSTNMMLVKRVVPPGSFIDPFGGPKGVNLFVSDLRKGVGVYGGDDALAPYHFSGLNFVLMYGILICAVVAVWAINYFDKQRDTVSRNRNMIFAGAMFLLGLLFWDFFPPKEWFWWNVWCRSRLVESWVNCILMLFMIATFTSKSFLYKLLGTTFLIIWTVFPLSYQFLFGHGYIVQQLTINLRYLLGYL